MWAFISLTCCFVAQSAAAQTYLANPVQGSGNGNNITCPQGSSYAIRTSETTGVYNLPALVLCLHTVDFARDPAWQTIQKQSAALALQEERIKELTAKNELLEKDLKAVSGALDALTARIDQLGAK
ncbi:hypothetical protein [Bradyrhizobium sp. HKCCYLS20291]|uniref:hypothetical protein n=1 Tax=Bradyrhizobium sp. HKCCYLS20291 TaxID=3420766 RepID=UPI003EBE7E28